ncbi:MAG: hypothetical protein HY746_08495, partial [Elusimicrobia bacterium]|nr:hypothetical protein [Elusimicrobiota bacterium]
DKLKKNYTSPRGELSGTKVGDELIAYYNDTKDTDPELKKLKQLNLSVNKLQDGMDAAYYPGTNEIVINKKKVEQWMRDNNMSADKLLDEKNEENFNGLTRYLAPIFVHEATHQTQAYWAKSNKIPDNYYLNQETESFAKEALFLKEKMENPATSKFYTAGSVSSSEIYLKNVLERDGLKGLRSYIRDYNIHNLEGEASKKFTRLEAALKEQNLRKNGVERDTLMPALCDKVKLSSCSDEQIQEMINTTYPWYKKAVQKEKKDAEFIQSELYRLDNLKKNYKYTIKSGEVPLMEEYGD